MVGPSVALHFPYSTFPFSPNAQVLYIHSLKASVLIGLSRLFNINNCYKHSRKQTIIVCITRHQEITLSGLLESKQPIS